MINIIGFLEPVVYLTESLEWGPNISTKMNKCLNEFGGYIFMLMEEEHSHLKFNVWPVGLTSVLLIAWWSPHYVKREEAALGFGFFA